MKKNLLIIVAIVLTQCYELLSQERPGMAGFSGEITGRIIEESTGKPLEYSNLTVFRLPDSTLAGGSITDTKGYFIIDKLKPGQYVLRAEFIGFEKFTTNVKVNPQNPSVNIGTIKLKYSSQLLSEVEVAGEKPMVEFTLDKKVINVEKNIVTAGGSATDILRTTPSVSVDMDGNVSLRGSTNVTILIDGKPSALSSGDKAAILEQIPASSIESIELITNPSAKYDPEGMAGIINIRTKKEKREGLNGLVTVNYGTWEKYGTSINLNRHTGIFNLFVNYDYKNNDREGTRKHYRRFYNNDTLTTVYDIFSERHSVGISHTIKGGFDVNLSPTSSFTTSATFRKNSDEGDDVNVNKTYDNILVLTEEYNRTEIQEEDGSNLDLFFGYRKKFTQKGRELTSDLIISGNTEEEPSRYIQEHIYPAGIYTPEQKAVQNDKYRNITFQSDYVHPFTEKTRFESGVKYMMRTTDNDYYFYNYDSSLTEFINDTTISNHFIYNDQIFAAYTTFSREMNKFSFQAGARAEQTYQDGNQKTLGLTYNRNYLNFFPSLHVSYSLPKENKLQVSYSRRINRPSIYSLNPFIDKSNPLTIHTGNPDLKPEYINSLELSHIKDWKKLSLTTSLFYKQTLNIISRYRYVDTTGAITVMPINMTDGVSNGLDFIISYQPVKPIRLMADFSWYQTTIKGNNEDNDLTNSILSYSAKFNASVTLPKSFSFQINFRLEGPSVMAQAIRKEFYTLDAGLRKDFKNKKFSVSFRVSDILNTMRFRVETNDEDLKANMEFKRQSRIAFVTLSYRINEGIKQKEKPRIQEQGNQEMEMRE